MYYSYIKQGLKKLFEIYVPRVKAHKNGYWGQHGQLIPRVNRSTPFFSLAIHWNLK